MQYKRVYFFCFVVFLGHSRSLPVGGGGGGGGGGHVPVGPPLGPALVVVVNSPRTDLEPSTANPN